MQAAIARLAKLIESEECRNRSRVTCVRAPRQRVAKFGSKYSKTSRTAGKTPRDAVILTDVARQRSVDAKQTGLSAGPAEEEWRSGIECKVDACTAKVDACTAKVDACSGKLDALLALLHESSARPAGPAGPPGDFIVDWTV